MHRRKIHLTTFQIILYAFAGAILVGAGILCIPASSRTVYSPSFLDALFTSTSAVCVTGLVVRDTYRGWSIFGRCIILCLIQVGGMGVVTIALLIGMISGRKISLFQRSVMKEAISAERIGGILRFTSNIFRITLATETAGACLLASVFCRQYGPWKGIGYAVFHSVSAFCNAGFDLCGKDAPFSSLTAYAANPIVNLVICALIITGGIGFHTWWDIRDKKFRFRRFTLQTKVILVTSALLILFPALYFYFFEFRGLPAGERVLAALFQAVTPRTAGFNTVDEAGLSQTGIMVTILLMLIGGAPGSTAGGMKVTTFAVLLAVSLSVFRHKQDTNIGNRRIGDETAKKAAAIFMMYFLLFIGSAMVISRVEHLPLLTCMYETASAIGTVGLTLGVTPTLSLVSKIILMVLMYFGRVGGLTIIFATVSARDTGGRYPGEEIAVG